MEDKIIATIPKSDIEEVRILLGEYTGKQRIDIRTWFKNQAGVLMPTKKGVSIPVEKWPELKKALKDLDFQIKDQSK